jgi:hypothetical protein
VQNRPSHKELTGKLRQARELLASPSDGYIAAELAKLAANFYDLGLFSKEAQDEALRAAFSEVTAKQYSGKRPPERAFECAVRDEEIFTFVWQSPFFKKKMYLKFCFHDSSEFEGHQLYIFSLHEDQPHRSAARKKS